MGEPIERDGALFTPDDFRYYNGELPTDVEPDRIFMAVDPAFGGGDFVASPVCYQYGEDIYVHDAIEENLYAIKQLLDSMIDGFQKSGMFQSGGMRMLPIRR